MKHQETKAYSAAFLVAACLLCGAPLQTRGSQGIAELHGVFSIHLEADKAAYAPGESVRLRVTITNIGSESYRIAVQPPSGLTELIVRDQNGAIVRSTGRYIAPWRTSAPEVAAGANFVPKYIPNGQGPGTQWEDITRWGYNLIDPGTYTIVAISKIIAYKAVPGGSEAFTTNALQSNVVQITIQQ